MIPIVIVIMSYLFAATALYYMANPGPTRSQNQSNEPGSPAQYKLPKS